MQLLPFFLLITGRLTLKKKILLYLHLAYLACWLALAIFAFFSARLNPRYALFIFFFFYGLSSFIIGIIIPPYFDYIGKVIPRNRGIYFGIALSSSAGLAIIGALLASRALDNFSFPASYAVCFSASFLIQFLSLIFFIFNVEHDNSAGSSLTDARFKFSSYLHTLFRILKEDKSYFNLLLVQIIISFGAMSYSFYTVYANSILSLSGNLLGRLTIMLVLGQVVAGIILGVVGDIQGHRFSLGIAILCGIGSAIIAIFGRSIGSFQAIFFLAGISLTSSYIEITNLTLEVATIDERSSYAALNSTLVGPFAAIAPLLGGILICNISYTFVFGLTAVVLIIGFLMVLFLKW